MQVEAQAALYDEVCVEVGVELDVILMEIADGRGTVSRMEGPRASMSFEVGARGISRRQQARRQQARTWCERQYQRWYDNVCLLTLRFRLSLGLLIDFIPIFWITWLIVYWGDLTESSSVLFHSF